MATIIYDLHRSTGCRVLLRYFCTSGDLNHCKRYPTHQAGLKPRIWIGLARGTLVPHCEVERMDNSRQKDTSPTPTTRTVSTATPFPSPVRASNVAEELRGEESEGVANPSLPQRRRFTAMHLVEEMQGVFYENSLVSGDFDPCWLKRGLEQKLLHWLPYLMLEDDDFDQRNSLEKERPWRATQAGDVDLRSEVKAVAKGLLPFLPCRAADLDGTSANFICAIYVGLEDDEEFCLVKRILGKGGCNMKKVVANSDAKVRLRGRSSGFLEGREQVEMDAPLQLHLSCWAFSTYCAAFVSLYDQIKQLHKHYRCYCRSKGMVAREDLEVRFEELRRADRGDFRSEAAPNGRISRTEDPQRPEDLQTPFQDLQRSTRTIYSTLASLAIAPNLPRVRPRSAPGAHEKEIGGLGPGHRRNASGRSGPKLALKHEGYQLSWLKG